jgi:hypothetical protein
MSVEQIESQLMELPFDERRKFARWFYDHEQKILETTADEAINPEIQAQVLRRLDDARSNPGLAVPVTDEWFQQLKERISIVRTSKAPAS